MRPDWTSKEFHAMRSSKLLFSAGEAAAMRRSVVKRNGRQGERAASRRTFELAGAGAAQAAYQSPEFEAMFARATELRAAGRYHDLRRYMAGMLPQAQALGSTAEVAALEWIAIAEAELGRFADAERTLLRCLDAPGANLGRSEPPRSQPRPGSELTCGGLR
jgi:hypothetical protein